MTQLALAAGLFALVACSSGGSRPSRIAAPVKPPSAPVTTTPSSPAAAPAPDECAAHPPPAAVALPERVTLGLFWQAMAAQVEVLDTSSLEESYAAFAARHQVDPRTPGLRRDFERLWSAFEATRDGGWWRLRWAVTDQEPRTHEIWKAWRRSPPDAKFDAASAIAECDEISALFSVAARRLGVRGVGLFYPTWNHVIAGWMPEALVERGAGAVVLVPTTQIFLSCESTFDQTSFRTPKRVYEYPLRDTPDDTELSPELAAFLLAQVRAYGEATPELLALIRSKRAELLRSSLGDCSAYRARLAAEIEPRLTCADSRALRHLARQELAQPELSDLELLRWLAS